MTDTDPPFEMTEEAAAEDSLTESLAEHYPPLESDPAYDTPNPPRVGPGWGALFAATLIASALGALGGWALTQNENTSAPDADAALTDIQTTQSKLASRLDTLESRPVPRRAPAPDLTPLETRLDALEARSAPARSPEITRPTESAPAASSPSTAAPVPATTQPPTPAPTPALTPALARRLADMDKRLTALETSPPASAPTPVQTARPLGISTKPLPTFPLKAVEDALNTQRDSVFGRVIGIRRAEDSDTLDTLQNALDNQDIAAALKAYDALPEAAQAAAADWATFARSRLQTEDPR